MSTLSSHNLGSGMHPFAPAWHYSRLIKFIDEIANHEPQKASTSVDIFSNDGKEWYCQVCRGGQKTQPMGPYTKRQAERIQDARRTRIAAKGTAWLVFEQTGEDDHGETWVRDAQ
ncbi:hypothetical protein ELI13_35905 [Rhizobium ruizarguesonis]|uniref:DUF2188 domain-containing protein n=1 Tax=Rhizobium ruizarguesonis TaxID=2081791 RepID=A0ABY1WVZ6_9HYPH|nr:hypothetical protein [Rhizobium ruizarguesonis]TAU13128.1 hypothetical protein ELI48_37905 [Rhizobium ruizarguesonis]TAU57032.1 hypothetical protein ELI45_38260 [Rhizobium ruizarguesonis]TAV19033.1 hypothetical protein ELI36_37935 [Rhizobium ruizarguesonis]TAW01876.1 hypothetical protein ELI26_39025 [Rhizobium ruizarguesonis]TAW47948.1 hypothetical protein ELI15_37790 [Rhizobium ruizarguesonis]